MPKKGHGQILRAGLDSSGDYFSAEVLEQAAKDAEGKALPVTLGYDPTKLVGACGLEWDPIGKSINIRPIGDMDSQMLEQLECAAAGNIIRAETKDEKRHIQEFQITSVGMFPPGKKIKTVEPEK